MNPDDEKLEIDFFLHDHWRLMEIDRELPEDISASEVHSAVGAGGDVTTFDEAATLDVGAMFSDDRDEKIESLSLKLLRHSIDLRNARQDSGRPAPVRASGMMAESTINFLAWEMLVTCQDNTVPYWLMRLLRSQLGIPESASINQRNQRRVAFNNACLAIYNNPEWSLRKVASKTGVNVSTISRWAREHDLSEIGRDLQHRRDNASQKIREYAAKAKAQREKLLAAGFSAEQIDGDFDDFYPEND